MNRQERAVRTREALVASAASIFGRHGYAGATLADISEGAGVSLGALHFHFENKAAVAEAVHAVAMARFRRAAEAVRRDSANAVQALTDLSHVVAHLLGADPLARAGLRLDRDDSFGGARAIGARQRTCIGELLSAARSGGELGEGVDVADIACTVLVTTAGVASLVEGEDVSLARTALAGFWRALHTDIAARGVPATLEPRGGDQVVTRALAEARQGERAGAGAGG